MSKNKEDKMKTALEFIDLRDTPIKNLSNKLEKQTSKKNRATLIIADLKKENQKLRETILLMEENKESTTRYWKKTIEDMTKENLQWKEFAEKQTDSCLQEEVHYWRKEFDKINRKNKALLDNIEQEKTDNNVSMKYISILELMLTEEKLNDDYDEHYQDYTREDLDLIQKILYLEEYNK